MERILGRYSSYLYAIFRIVFGLSFMLHGTQKFFNWPLAFPGGDLGGMMLGAAVIELVAGFLILIGLFASLAAFVASGLMAVAYFMVHFPKGAFPIANGGELAVLYCFAFLYIASRGAGVWSVDSLMRGTRVTSGGDRS